MTDKTTDRQPRHISRTPTLRLLQLTTTLTLLAILYQFITAGQLLSGNKMAHELHGTGAIVLHVITGLAMIAAAIDWRLRRVAIWPTVVLAIVFVLTFVQAELGASGILWAHIPGAFLLTFGAIWVAAWSFSRSSRRTAPRSNG